jgi:colanic acid/amylovoran biosynthesis glycosyltransferase
LTNRTENLDIFPFNPIFSYKDVSLLQKVFIRLGNNGFKDVYRNFFCLLLKKHAARLMHSHFGYCGVEFLDMKRKLDLPMVTSFYGSDMSLLPRDPQWKKKYEVLFGEGERFLVEGPDMKEGLLELGCPEKRIVAQHLGVDLQQFPMVPRTIRPDGIVRILVAGTFREKKGIPYALEAFARVKQKHKNMHLTLIGDASVDARDKVEKTKILEVLRKYDLYESVTCLGFQPHNVFREQLIRHDIFLSPSVEASDGDSEGGSPVSITEAQATGMPVLATFHADIPEVVLDGETGLLSPERDIEALTANLEFLVTHPEKWEEMGRQSRSHIEKEYDVKIQAKKLQEIYSSILSSKNLLYSIFATLGLSFGMTFA